MLLDESAIDRNEIVYVRATLGQRFGNYLIDAIMIYVTIFALTAGLTLFMIMQDKEDTALEIADMLSGSISSYVVGAIITIIYYSLLEGFAGGKTIGKLVTKTTALNLDGSKMDMATVVTRSASRIVPFEAFSFLGNKPIGWHDKWTDTAGVQDPRR